MTDNRKLVFCNCSYAKTVPEDVKTEVLKSLLESGVNLRMYADLCEMSAKKDPELAQVFAPENGSSTCIVACHKRSLKGLAHAAGQTWNDEAIHVWNMKEDSAENIIAGMTGGEPSAN